MDHTDLKELLQSWPYEPGRVNARRITGEDDRPKLQVRIDLGVLQMEMEGRPDGQRPQDCESLLAYHMDRRDRYASENGGPDGFLLSPDECRALREEAVQYYHRYVALMSIGEFAGVVRDTTRNLEVCDLCRGCAAMEPDRSVMEQFRPHVIVMRARADAGGALAAGRKSEARAAIDQGLAELRSYFDTSGRGVSYEQANEVQVLRGMREALVPKLPVSQQTELLERLQAALDAENYELAAVLRDELRLLE